MNTSIFAYFDGSGYKITRVKVGDLLEYDKKLKGVSLMRGVKNHISLLHLRGRTIIPVPHSEFKNFLKGYCSPIIDLICATSGLTLRPLTEKKRKKFSSLKDFDSANPHIFEFTRIKRY